MWNEIFIALVMLGICHKIDKLRVGKRSMYIHISGWHTFGFGTFSSLTVVMWRRWCSGGGGGTGSGGGASICLGLNWVCRFFVVPLWQEMQPSIRFSRIIARCHSITAFSWLCPGNTAPHILWSRTLARGFLLRNCISCIMARENLQFAIFAIYKARCMLDCWSCTRPPCLAIAADLLNTYKKAVTASKMQIWLLPLPYVTP